jgi:hypothetical protein
MAELGDDGRAAANVAKLLRIARRYERQDAGDLRGFLDHAAFARDKPGRPDPPAPVADERAEAVHLMTIHAAKGLEFGVVCVAELGARPNAELPDLLVDGERIGVRLVRLGQYESVAALSFDELAAERREAAEREEDRLLYVALTRARERLLLSGVVAFKRWPEVTEGCAPVNWLAPALVDDVARRVEQAREQAGMGAGVEVGVEAGVEAAERAGRQVGVGLTRGETVVGPAGTVRLILNPAVSGEAPGPAGLPVQPPASRGDRDPSDAGPVGVVGDPVAAPTGRPPRAADAVEQSTAPLAHVTYTALSELQRCAYRYYLEHVLRLPQPPHEHAADVVTGARAHDAAAMDAQARGTLVHRLLETLDFAADDPLGADDVAAQAGELGIAPTAAECSAIAAVVQAARRTPLAARLAVAGVRRELPFAFSVGPSEVLVTGRLDAVVGADGGPCLVVDYKTDRLRDGEDLEAVVGERYGTQRLIYALAALQAGHSEVEVVHWFLERPREWAHARFSAAQAVDLREGLAHKLAHIQARGYVVSDTPHVALCTGCPGRGTLCSHSLAATFAVRPGELGEAAAPTAPVPNQ